MTPTKKKIVILAANPVDIPHLRLDQEMQQIHEGLRRSKLRDSFELVVQTAVTARLIREILLNEKPQIVHFLGHGAKEDGLVVNNQYGKSQILSERALADLFRLCKAHVECVVLNACYSQIQAKAISKNIQCTIGISKRIADHEAIEFAVGFYSALGSGEDYGTSFEHGRNAIDCMEGASSEFLTLHLIEKTEVSPSMKPRRPDKNEFNEFNESIPLPK